jgi:hypothetical protein
MPGEKNDRNVSQDYLLIVFDDERVYFSNELTECDADGKENLTDGSRPDVRLVR